MRLQLLPEFIQFSIPAEFFSIILTLAVFLFFFLRIPEYTNNRHASDHEKSKCKSQPISICEKGNVLGISGLRHTENQKEFAQRVSDQTENQAENKNIYIAVAIGKVI